MTLGAERGDSSPKRKRGVTSEAPKPSRTHSLALGARMTNQRF